MLQGDQGGLYVAEKRWRGVASLIVEQQMTAPVMTSGALVSCAIVLDGD